jgi:hypothetical protein
VCLGSRYLDRFSLRMEFHHTGMWFSRVLKFDMNEENPTAQSGRAEHYVKMKGFREDDCRRH